MSLFKPPPGARLSCLYVTAAISRPLRKQLIVTVQVPVPVLLRDTTVPLKGFIIVVFFRRERSFLF